MKRRNWHPVSLLVMIGLLASLGMWPAAPVEAAGTATLPLPRIAAPTTFSCDSVSQIPRAECEALVAVYNSTDGAHWNSNAGWLATDTPCNWFGVTCMVQGQVSHVTGLRFFNNQLTGGIPPQLGNLAQLEQLGLDFNPLGGSIPPELGQLANLKSLYLSYDQLTGQIPLELTNLGKLEQLSLWSNQLTGNIPPQMQGLTALKSLSLSANRLTGSIPPELGNLSHLEDLFLEDNQLTGGIPAQLGNLTSLGWLDLNKNRLTGSIPPELGNLSHLEELFLADNQLTGGIPPQLGNLTSLSWLDLSANQLTGSVPQELGRLEALRDLTLDGNALVGPLPRSLLSLRLNAFLFDRTNLCAPADAAFSAWLAGIQFLRATYRCHAVSGKVKDGVGQPMAGVLVSAGPAGSGRTDALGVYTVDDLVKSTYTFTPALPGYRFVPPARLVQVTGDITGLDFLIEPGPLAVSLTGANVGKLGEHYTFFAAAAPLTTTLPITYTWEATGQAAISHAGGLADSATFTWTVPGIKTVTVSAVTAGETASATKSFGVYAYIYLEPLFVVGSLAQ